jgi:hypothetical protein
MTDPQLSETTGLQEIPGADQLPAAVLEEARRELPGDVTAYHDALLAAADAHDPIRMDHLVHGWSMARDVLEADTDEEHRAWAVLDRRLGQVLFGEGLPAAADVLVDAIAHAAASGDTVEELRCRLAFVPVEVAVGDATALDSGAGYVEQLLALEEYGHAAGGLMGLAHVVPDGEAASMLLRASHLYERAGDGGWAAEAAVIAARAMTTTGDARLGDTLTRAHELVEAHPTVELRISLAEIQALLAWQGGDPASAAAILRAAIDAAARTGRPVPPGLQVMLCDLLVETGDLGHLREPASALVEVGKLLDDDELTSMGERYLALVP